MDQMEMEDVVHAGRKRLEWETDEYTHHQRSKLWYVLMSLVGVALIIYAVMTANFLFAVIILMVGIITLVSTFTKPDRVPVILTTTGIVVSDEYFEYAKIRDFSIAYQPPDVKLLYIDFHSSWQPLIAIPLEDTDPNEVRTVLLEYVEENLDRTEERLTDTIKRLYKI